MPTFLTVPRQSVYGNTVGKTHRFGSIRPRRRRNQTNNSNLSRPKFIKFESFKNVQESVETPTEWRRLEFWRSLIDSV
jgi:hypothetical protein